MVPDYRRRMLLQSAALSSFAVAAGRLHLSGGSEPSNPLPPTERPEDAGAPRPARLAIHPRPSCYSGSSQFSVSVDGQAIPVIEYSNNKKVEYCYAHFSFSGEVTIQIDANEPIKDFRIRPLSYELSGAGDGPRLTFRLARSRYLLININKLMNLIILADPIEREVPPTSGDGIFNIRSMPYSADNTGVTVVTDIVQLAIDDCSAQGGGIVYVPAGVYSVASLTMKSRVGLYLEPGAVIRGTGKHSDYISDSRKSSSIRVTTLMRFARNSEDMRIWGRGTVDANGEILYDNGGGKDPAAYRICALRPDHNSRVTIDGVIVSHGRTWTVVPQQSNRVRISNVKLLNSEYRSNNDGIDINSCQKVKVQHCFTYTNDDSLCVKPCTVGNFNGVIQGPDQPCHDIEFDDVVVYGLCAGTKVGLQGHTHTRGIWFRNIEVLQCSRGIVVQHWQGRGVMENIHFENMHIEQLVRRVYRPFPIEMTMFRWRETDSDVREGGQLRNIRIENIRFENFGDGDAPDGYNGQNSILYGKNPSSGIHDLVFRNLKIAGKLVLDAEGGRIDINKFVSRVTFM
jgi:hypothetical protein